MAESSSMAVIGLYRLGLRKGFENRNNNVRMKRKSYYYMGSMTSSVKRKLDTNPNLTSKKCIFYTLNKNLHNTA